MARSAIKTKQKPQLSLSADSFQTIIENSTDAITLSDKNGKFFYANPAVAKVTGYSPAEFVKFNRFQLIHPDYLNLAKQQLNQLLAQPEVPITIQLQLKHKDGSWRWLETTFTNALSNPHLQAIIANYRDITQSKAMEQQLKRQAIEAENERARLEFGQKAGRIGTYEWDLVTDKTVWTKEFEALYGFSHGGFKAGNTEAWLKCLHPDDRDRVVRDTARALRHDHELNIEYRVIWPDHTLHYLANRSQIIRDRQGKAILLSGVNIDITERKIFENNLAYLSEASKILASSLDYETTLANVAKLAVPQIADWCSVTIKQGDELKPLAVAHADPKKVKWAEEFRQASRPSNNTKRGVGLVMQTGKSELYSHITDDMLEAASTSQSELAVLRKLKMTSIMIVPLLLHEQAIGAISFVAAESGRTYTDTDLTMAEEVASRMALAIENARLYAEATEVDELQKRLAAIVESSDDAIIGKSIDGFITSWNLGAEHLYGYTPEEIIGQPVSTLMPPEKKDDFPKIMRQLQRGQTVKHYQTKRQTKDGRILDVSITVSPIRNAQGKIIGASKVARDITEQKKAEQRQEFLENATTILNSSINYETTLKNLGKIIIPYLADYCRIVVLDEQNHSKEIMVKHTNRRQIPLIRQLYDAYKNDATAGVESLLQTGKSELIRQMTPEVLQTSNSQVRDIIQQLHLQSYMGAPMKIGDKVIGALTFSSTQENRLYTTSDLALAEELARRAALAIENAKLYAASQVAVALRDDFISVASHELKTPVTSTKIFTQVLLRHATQSGDHMAVEHLRKMDRQLNKLTELIYNMLDISKMQIGRMDLNQDYFDFDAAVGEVAELLQNNASKHKIIIKGQTKQTVFGDEDRIGQVVSNLLSNAIKYSPQADQVVIHLKHDAKTVTCGVQDFGIGISKPHFNHIFERFYRVFDATDKTFPGLGIGLYISAEITKRHNGRLWVESNMGQGSTFYFSLPISPKESS